METLHTFTAFEDLRRLASGPVREVLETVARHLQGREHNVLIFDDRTGAQVEFDLRGSVDEVLARLDADPAFAPPAAPRPGRPKLGVVSREVSLLPRHWEWLDRQPGGCSGALRRLVEGASKAGRDIEAARAARDAVGKFMWGLAGDLPGFEEASRALYAGRFGDLRAEIAAWPSDVRAHVEHLCAVAERLAAAAQSGASTPDP